MALLFLDLEGVVMKIVKVAMELVIDEDLVDPVDVSEYLNRKLYKDPEFFGDFGPENVVSVSDFD